MTAAPITLHSLGGGSGPPDLAGDLCRLLRLPPEGLGKLWQVLSPCLAEKIGPETEKLLDVYCSAYGISGDDLGRAIRAARFLIQAAAKLDVPAERFAEDLAALCPDARAVHEVLLAGYEPAKKQLRQAAAMAAIVGHGKLLTDVEWRLDLIQTSERGGAIRAPITMVTLHYVDGQEKGRVTLQALPDMIEKLGEMCQAVLSRGR